MKKTYRSIISAMLAVILAVATLTGCTAKTLAETPELTTSGSNALTESTMTEQTTQQELTILQSAEITDVDLLTSWDDTATEVLLSGSTMTVTGAGASVNGSVLTITKAGVYVISGKLDDGQINIEATKNDTIRIVLNGADITNRTGAAIYASQCDKLVVTLADGMQNILTDGGANFAYANADEEPNAALFSKDDLTINGNGALTVNAGCNNGIGTKDDLLILGGTFVISAANHGLRGNDSVTVVDGDFTITAGNDGMQTNNTTDTAKGYILIENGSYNIVAAHDGIQADATLTIVDGTFTINAGGGAAKTQTVASSDTASDSFKGLKSAGDIVINGGMFVIDCYDDGVHSNGNITINCGDFTISSGDDGVHADGDLKINDGGINVTKSYEGLEGSAINIAGGTITVVASDDGINAAGGTDGSFGGGPFGNDRFATGGTHTITITRGVITVYSGSDGIDANGTLDVTGGTVAIFVYAPRDGDTIDTDNGGTIPPTLFVSSAVKAGTKIAVDDLWSISCAADATAFCLLIPGIVDGQSYNITANGSALTNVTATTIIQGMMMGGGMGGTSPR